MDGKETILLLMLLFNYCFLASSDPVSNNLASEHFQANARNEGENGNGMVHHSKIAHGAPGGGANGGQEVGAGENGNGGQPGQGAGTAVIPVYAAGAAASQRRNHHSAATHGQCYIGGLHILIATILIWHLFYYTSI